ncbi:MAG TPA: DUF202 domain-containing protein [Thermoleophilaceae bacterium]|nr:DUF202 domain-containing protein [Thermoleophilaceae bacterium]
MPGFPLWSVCVFFIDVLIIHGPVAYGGRAELLSAGAGATESADAGAARRTKLAAERTWLAWWRTALAATAAGLGVGRLLPEVTTGTTWPYVVIGAGYTAVGLALVLAGGIRQARIRAALRGGSFEDLEGRWIAAFTVAGTILTLATLAVVVFGS